MTENDNSASNWATELDVLREGGKWDAYIDLLDKLLRVLRDGETQDEYMDLLDKVMADTDECYASAKPSTWTAGRDICDKCLAFLDEIAEVDPQLPQSRLDQRKYWKEKGRKRKEALRDPERYKGPCFVLMREGCNLKITYTRTATRIPDLQIQGLSQPASDMGSEVVSETWRLRREMQSWRIGNKTYLQNLRVAAYSAWQRDFEGSPFLVSIMRYSALESLMKLEWHLGFSLLRKRRVPRGCRHIINSVGLFMLGLVSGFGEKVGRYLVSVATVVFAFGLLYSLVGQVKSSACGGIVDRLVDGIYFSVVSFTTLGFGDYYPSSYLCRALAGAEAVIGYIMLAILVHLITRKLEL